MESKLPLDPQGMQLVQETYRILRAGNLVVHPSVTAVVLGGSRGPNNCYRPDSDIDLSLIVDSGGLAVGPKLGQLLDDVLQTTLKNWRGEVELDLAAVFDMHACGLKCFGQSGPFDLSICGGSGRDCFGIYKIQRGFSGFVPPFGVLVEKINPSLILWQKN